LYRTTLWRMNEQEFKDAVDRLNAVNEVVESLDASIRQDAFELLKPYIVGGVALADEIGDDGTEEDDTEKPDSRAGRGTVDFDKLIEVHESDTDHENALVALAIAYARHGKGPYELSVIKAVADEFSLTVPSRLDMTFKRLKRDDKEVLRKQSDGWKVTPSGEAWLKSTYGVSRGKTPPP
jgi:hypothetical protein